MNRDSERQLLMARLRRHGISDERVLAAMAAVPREAFVGTALQTEAYDDEALPIDCGQTISQPYIVAYMTQQLGLKPEHHVLEIGTGSGYQAAVLARLASKVCTIERHQALAEEAKRRFQALGIGNIVQHAGDGTKGWPDGGAFDRIIVTAAAKSIPPALLAQLADGGVLVGPAGESVHAQYLWRITRHGKEFRRERLIGVRFVPLLEGSPVAT